MNGEIFYEYIANVLFPWLQQNNPTVSCISNPICFDDHNPFTSSILDFIVTNNVLKLTASKACNVITSVSNLASSNISVEVTNSEYPAFSLISNTFEAEFADLEVSPPLSHI